MRKEWQGLEEVPEAEIQADLLIATLMKVSNWKKSGHGDIQSFWLKEKLMSIHDRLALQPSKYLEDA